MARRKSRTLTEVELEFMQVIWPRGEVTVEDIQDALREDGRHLSGGSIRKILSILIKKGYASRRRGGRGHTYKARVPEDKATRSMVLDLLKRAFDGSAAMMVATLLDAKAVRTGDIERIKALIAERERGARK